MAVVIYVAAPVYMTPFSTCTNACRRFLPSNFAQKIYISTYYILYLCVWQKGFVGWFAKSKTSCFSSQFLIKPLVHVLHSEGVLMLHVNQMKTNWKDSSIYVIVISAESSSGMNVFMLECIQYNIWVSGSYCTMNLINYVLHYLQYKCI